MRSRLVSTVIAASVAALALGAARTAAAQAALDDDDDADSTPSSPTNTEEDLGPKTMIGVGLRVRQMFVPQGLVEIFVDHASGGSSQTGLGLEISRRKGDFEVQFGLEWDNIYIKPGYWIDKGDTIPQDEPDYVEFDKKGYLSWGTFGWLSAEVSFLNHTEIAKQFSIRYGGGAGIAVNKGHVQKTDSACTSSDIDSCSEYGQREAYNIPPVMLVVNAIIGVQVRPIPEMYINIEGGLRTFPFAGLSAGGFF
jgi:hypothetical protein